MAAVITEFVDGLPGEVRKMSEFLEQNDMASLRRVVHQLRGAGGGYGFQSITDLATITERSIDASGQLESTTAQINELIELIKLIDGYDETKARDSVLESAR